MPGQPRPDLPHWPSIFCALLRVAFRDFLFRPQCQRMTVSLSQHCIQDRLFQVAFQVRRWVGYLMNQPVYLDFVGFGLPRDYGQVQAQH